MAQQNHSQHTLRQHELLQHTFLRQELQRIVPGHVHTTRQRHTDFSNLPGPYPSAVLRDLSDDQLSTVLDFAAQRGLQLSVRGSGHSCNGQTSSGQILLDLRIRRKANAAVSAPPIHAGMQWGNVERGLRKQHKAIPILADHYGLTVGGTLSVGCYGADSLRQGALVHHVKSMEVMTADGNLVTCNEDQHASLFNSTLAGLGGSGIIRRAELCTTEHAPFTFLQSYRANSLTELAEHAIAAHQTDADLFKALWANGRYAATYGRNYNQLHEAKHQRALLDQKAYISWHAPRYRAWRSLAVRFWVGRYHGAAKIWSDYLLPEAGLLNFCEDLQTALNEPIAQAVKAIYLLPIKQSRTSNIYLEGSNTMTDGQTFGIGLYCMLPRSDLHAQHRLYAWLRERLSQALNKGGTPYLYGHHQLDSQIMQQAFGASWQAYRNAREQWNGQARLRHVLPT